MFGATNPFGQSSSSSPFGSQPVFGQTSAASNNPFAPKPFGGTTPFGSPQTGSPLFGGTSTGMFGTPQASPFSSASSFGVSSTPAFGASSTPAFGSTSSAFGGSSAFGQKPAFGGFGSTTQASPFGSTTPQSQSAFGSGLFGSTAPFGGSTQPAFGASSTPAFGSTTTPAFGATTTPSFGSTSTVFGSTASPAFGSTAPGFGVSNNTPVFGSGAAFGSSNTSVFGQTTAPSFGSSSTPAFGVSGATGFGSSTTSPFGNASSSPAFGAPNPTPATPSFSFSSGTGFGQSTSPFGNSTPFGSTGTPSFGGQSSSFGVQTTAPAFGTGFGQSALGGQRGGSRVAPYAPTTEAEGSGSAGQAGKLESISAMPVYKDKSHEELRWEDYQLGDKGGPAPVGASSVGTGFGASVTPSIGQSSNPFSTSTSPNPFAAKPQTTGSSPFPSQSSIPFQSAGSFGVASTSAFTSSSSPSPFGISSQSAFGSTPSVFTSTTSTGTVSPFGSSLNFSNPQGGTFQPTTPSLGQSGSVFGQSSSVFGQSGSAFGLGQSGSAFGQTGSAFGQSNMFNTSGGFGGGSGSIFPSSASVMPSTSTAVFGQSSAPQSTMFQPPQTGAFSFTNSGQTQGAGTSNLGGASSIFGQSNIGQLSVTPNSLVQPVTAANPFGTLPAMPQMSIGRAGTTPSLQYGISSMPVVEKPAPVRISSMLTSRHLSQRRIKLPARKYNPKHDGPKVPFFSDEEETPSTPKADALFIPRENPRALVIRPVDQWPSRTTSAEKASPLKEGASAPIHENGKSCEAVDGPSSSDASAREKNRAPVENGVFKDRIHGKLNQKPNGVNEDHASQKEEPYKTLSGHRAGEAAIVYEHGADIEALMPKLRRSDYFTEPRIQELAAKERAEPGFCRHVKDFVVGRHGCGSIKFLGETDVRRLDLESIIQFNNREVIVYLDDSKKPPVGQGLNKPAVVTLLNIKCFDKKTGSQVTEGPKIERYMDMLKRKAEEQGAEFISYDAAKGEWKFKANHFSKYKLSKGDEEDDCDANASDLQI